MNFGSFEILALIMIFFILFGADRLPKLAKAMGQSKGEFQKGLQEATSIDPAKTVADLESGGMTEEQRWFKRAKDVGLDPTGMSLDEIKKKVGLLENDGDKNTMNNPTSEEANRALKGLNNHQGYDEANRTGGHANPYS